MLNWYIIQISMARNQSGWNTESSYFISAQNKTRLNQKYSEWCPEASGLNILFSENKVHRETHITHIWCKSCACHYLHNLTLFQIHMTLPFGSDTEGDLFIYLFFKECLTIWSIVYKSDGLLLWTFSVLFKCESFSHFSAFVSVILVLFTPTPNKFY